MLFCQKKKEGSIEFLSCTRAFLKVPVYSLQCFCEIVSFPTCLYVWKQTLRLNCLNHTARKCPGQDLSSLLTDSELHILATKLTGFKEMARQGCLSIRCPHNLPVGETGRHHFAVESEQS